MNLRPPPTTYNPRRDEITPFASITFIFKINLSFIKRATYSHFLRSLSSTFVVNENCFSEKWPLNVTVSVETAYGFHSSESVASCCVVGRTPGDTRDGLDRAELLRWRPFPVRFTSTVETSIGRGENWSLLL